MNGWISFRQGRGALAIAAVCGCCALLAAAPASAAPTGSILGTVTAADTHAGLEGAEVCASRFVEDEEGEGERVDACDETGPTGAYSIGELEDGEYAVHFRPGDLPYFGQEDWVTVAGGSSAGADAELEPAATIAGTVTGGGEPIDEGKVCAWRLPSAQKGLCTRTGEDGRYAIRFATPGEFRVEFQAVGGFATQYFDHKRHAAEANPVAATLGAVHGAVDASLEAGGWIKGTVRANTGTPLQEILVCAVEASALEPEACDETGVFGQYSVGPLATGSYKVGFSVELGREFFGEELFLGEDDGFQTRFYDEQTSLAAATAIGLLAPSSVLGIDAHLTPSTPSTAVPPPAFVLSPPAATPPPATAKPKRLRCRPGFKKKKVRGKVRCVKIRKHRRRG